VFASHFQVKALLKYPGGLSHFSVENSTLKKKNTGPRTLKKKNNEAVLHCMFALFLVFLFIVYGQCSVNVFDRVMWEVDSINGSVYYLSETELLTSLRL